MKTTFLFIAMMLVLGMMSCSESEKVVRFTTLRVEARMPQEYEEISPEGLTVVITNTGTNKSFTGMTDVDGIWSVSVEEGIYNLKVSGKKMATGDTVGAVALLFQATKQTQSVVGESRDFVMELEYSQTGSPWLFKEIYFAGSMTSANKSYQKDQFLEIFNNSEDTLYADGLAVCETYTTTSVESTVQWNQFLPDRIAVQALYSVPGEGRTYPVAPGKSFVIANKALNHRGDPSLNPNSPVDLSGADFEWVDANAPDIDVPEVPNLIKNFCYTATIWVLNQQGTKSYLVFRPDTDMKTFMEKNHVQVLNASGSKLIDAYAVPRSLIFDGVELSKKNGLKEKALPSSIDAGYSYTEATGNGKSIRRKVASRENGRIYLQDTNNSTDDFLVGRVPAPFAFPE